MDETRPVDAIFLPVEDKITQIYVFTRITIVGNAQYSQYTGLCMNMNAWIGLMMFVTPLQVCSAAIDPGMNSPEKINFLHFRIKK